MAGFFFKRNLYVTAILSLFSPCIHFRELPWNKKWRQIFVCTVHWIKQYQCQKKWFSVASKQYNGGAMILRYLWSTAVLVRVRGWEARMSYLYFKCWLKIGNFETVKMAIINYILQLTKLVAMYKMAYL